MSKDRPIIFSAPMVRALLEGRKTMTRRLTKIQLRLGQFAKQDDMTPWRIGDIGWVKETWRANAELDNHRPSELPEIADIWFEADGVPPFAGKKRHSIFLPRERSRLTLVVNGVKVERLHEISLRDVRSEGCEVREFWVFGADAKERQAIGAGVRKDLWEKLHGPASWAANPNVVALSFRVIRANIDSAEAAA